MAYANGANPQVPPYLALGELNRRKQMMEKSQAEQMQAQAQGAQGTVKDQVEQQAGVMALQQGRQQQAMQNAVRMGSMAPAGIPAGIPQPQPQTVQAAGGGLLSLLANRARRYNSGGVIAFQEAGSVDDALDEENDEEDDKEEQEAEDQLADRMVLAKAAQATPTGTRDLLAEVIRQGQQQMADAKPKQTSYLEQRRQLIEKNPELAAALTDTTGDQLKRLDEIQALRRAEFEKQREEAARMRPGILQQLGQAAMASRGSRGSLASILGGYSDISSRNEAAAIKQEQDLRMREIELQQTRAEALNKIDDIKRARADGDLQKEMQSVKDYQNLLKAHNTSTAQLFGRQASALGRLAGAEVSGAARERAAATTAASRERAAETTARGRIQAAGIVKPGERERIANRIVQLRAEGKDDEADRLQTAYTSLGGGTAGVGQTNAIRAALNIRLREANRVLDPKNIESTAEQRSAAAAERDEILQALRELGPTSAAKPSAAKPAAPSATPPVNLLKQGVNTTFKNGQTWTLDANGQPKQVK